ncbi:MAG: hypothetical protein Q9168_004026 [Polycauliona sp. 1 TL-2023]
MFAFLLFAWVRGVVAPAIEISASTPGNSDGLSETPRIQPTRASLAATPTVISTPTGSSNTTNDTSSPTTHPAPWLNRQTRIALGVGISVGVLLSFTGLVFGVRTYRKKKRASIEPSDNSPVSDEAPPFLQQKPELDANGNVLCEIDGVEARYELEADTEIREMSTAVNTDGRREMGGDG